MAADAGDIRPEDVEPVEDADRDAVRAFIARRWGSAHIVTRAREHDASLLPGFLVRDGAGLMGVVTLSVMGPECEVVTIDASVEDRGIGSALLGAAEDHARAQGCDRMWLVTTNDNLRALGFYQRRGFRIVAVHPDAVTRSRQLKPEIPLVADNGIPVLDEIELEKPLVEDRHRRA